MSTRPGLLTELKRRNVFRVALFYIVASWVVFQVAETLLPVFDVPDSAIRIIVLILALGFPLAVVFSWVFEMTPERTSTSGFEGTAGKPAGAAQGKAQGAAQHPRQQPVADLLPMERQPRLPRRDRRLPLNSG